MLDGVLDGVTEIVGVIEGVGDRDGVIEGVGVMEGVMLGVCVPVRVLDPVRVALDVGFEVIDTLADEEAV